MSLGLKAQRFESAPPYVVVSSGRRNNTSANVSSELAEWCDSIKMDIEPFYQPIICSDGFHCGYEVVARIKHDGMWKSPGHFITALEAQDAISQLDETMWTKVMADLEMYRFKRGMVTVNTSVQTLEQQNFGDLMRRLKQRYDAIEGAKPVLNVEVTETAKIKNTEAVVSSLSLMSDIGVGIILDDFGSGYNSLGLLLTLPNVSYVKFSMEITKATCLNKKAKALMKDLTHVAMSHGAQVIFEGIETRRECEVISKLAPGVYMQGFYFAEPARVGDVALGKR